MSVQDRDHFTRFFRERFGVDPQLWTPYRLRIGSQSVHVVSRSVDPELWDQEGSGLRVATLTSRAFQPSTRGVQWLGDRITRSRLSLTGKQWRSLLDRETVRDPEWDQQVTRGFVALFFDGWAIGSGFWSGEELRTQVSKGLSRQFPRRALT